MIEYPDRTSRVPSPLHGTGHPPGLVTDLRWTDTTGKVWNVGLMPSSISFQHGDQTIELPSESWKRDIYVAAHGDGFIIRLDLFRDHVGFMVPAQDARPFLEALGSPAPKANAELEPGTEPNPAMPLLWPKVSPLAVWALIASSLVFVPGIGILAAVATIVLLIQHKAHVRPSPAWSHSRSICSAAFYLLVTGLIVNAIGTWGMLRSLEVFPGPTAIVPAESKVVALEPLPCVAETPAASRPLRAALAETKPFLERDHNWGLIIVGVLVVLLSLTVHEAAHAITAWWMGDDFAHRLGRVTLNPLAHIDPFGTVLFPVLLLLMNSSVWGWAKPVPVMLENVNKPRRAQVLVALAGPGSNLLMAAASLMLLLGLAGAVGIVWPGAAVENLSTWVLRESVQASGFPMAGAFGPVCTLLKLSFVINVLLAFFNLIPIPPLDGSWVLQFTFPRTLGLLYERIRPFSMFLFLGLMYSGAMAYLTMPGQLALLPGFFLLRYCTVF